MRHEDAVALFPDFRGGALADERREAVESHLAACAGCRETLQAFEAVNSALEDAARHPQSEQLVALAVGPERLPQGQADDIRLHVDRCPECADDLRRVREADAGSMPGPISVRPAATTGWRWAIAAALAGLAVLVGVDITMRSGGGVEEEWGGAVGLPVLSSALRQAAERPVVEIVANQPVAALAIELDPTSFDEASRILRFSIEHGDRGSIWQRRLTASRAAELLDSDGVVTLLVPASVLQAGRYRLRVVPELPEGAGALLQVDFDVRR